MTFEEWLKGYRKTHGQHTFNASTTDWTLRHLEDSWNAATAEAEKRAEEHDKQIISRFAQDAAQDIRTRGAYYFEHLAMPVIRDAVKQVAAEARRDALEEAHKIFNWHDGVPNLSHWLKREIDKANRFATPPASGQAEASGEK